MKIIFYRMKTNIKVLALDLEGTLISNAMSQIPRPGLFNFLENVKNLFPRIVMFTTVREEKFREIAKLLATEGYAPEWFRSVEYVSWQGKTKDLTFISGVEVHQALLVDDLEKYIHPGQEQQWIQIDYFDYPYPDDDVGLSKVFETLKEYGT